MPEEIYNGLAPAAPWPGGRLWTASNAAGETVFLREAGKAEAGAAPFLSHPVLPVYLGEGSSAEAPGVKFSVYQYFEGPSVAGQIAGGGTFTQFEALKISYDMASALKYLHGLSPRVAHGAVSAEAVFRAGGGRALLCGCAASGDIAGDLKGLAGLMRSMAAAPKTGNFSPGYQKVVAQIELPGASADSALKAMEALAAGPGYLPEPGTRKAPVNYRPFIRKLIALSVLVFSFSVAFKFRLDYWPQIRAQRNIKLETSLHRDYPCNHQLPPGPPQEGVNLLKNPGLEGACGWHSWGGWERGMIERGSSHEGIYYVEVPGPEYGVWQDVDLSAFAGKIQDGGCEVRLGGWLRSTGYGSDGEPYIFGYAMRSENDYTYLSEFAPEKSDKWNYSYRDWPLPAGTRKVRVILQKSSRLGSWLSKDAYFDELTAEVRCR